MRYSDLVAKLAADTKLSKKSVDQVLDGLRDVLKQLPVGERVIMPKLGTFEAKQRKARTVPSINGGTVDIPARRALTFSASKVGV